MADDVERAVPVRFVDFHRKGCADPVALQKQHHFFDLLLFCPAALDDVHAFGTDTVHLVQPFQGMVDYVEGCKSKMVDDAVGGDGTDAFDQTGAQVFAESLHRRRILQ